MNTSIHPLALENKYSTATANARVQLYAGAMILRRRDKEFKGKGNIQLQWLPAPFVSLEIEIAEKMSGNFLGEASIEAIDKWPGEFIDVDVTWSPMFSFGEPFTLLGVIHKWSRNQSTQLKGVVFHIPNFRYFRGEPIRNERGASWAGRTHFTLNNWRVTIDAVLQQHLKDEIKAIGGFGITHVGFLEQHDATPFLPIEVEKQLEALDWLLSFCNGRWTAPILPLGYDTAGQLVWSEWSIRHVAPFRRVRSWFSDLLNGVLPKVSEGFARKWFDSTWSRSIRTAIYWYLTSNVPGVAIESGVILAHVAFETLGWTLFVEDMKSLSADGYNRLTAADKLRLVLSHCDISLDLPSELSSLEAAGRAENWNDGPAAISAVRNSHVHPSPKNRDQLSRIGVEVEHQAWVLSMQYLELILLRLFDYSGMYCSRLVGGVHESQALRQVPWAPSVP